jgi:hypothetical protein
VAKLPMMLMTPKMRPFFDLIVIYEPWAFPGTGVTAEALVRSSCIFAGLPILSLVEYTVKIKVWKKVSKNKEGN